MRVTLRISRPEKSAAVLGVGAAITVNAIAEKQHTTSNNDLLVIIFRNIFQFILRILFTFCFSAGEVNTSPLKSSRVMQRQIDKQLPAGLSRHAIDCLWRRTCLCELASIRRACKLLGGSPGL